jgi:hypothetical protein
MTLRVECYAGAKADERPVRFQLGERNYMVDGVLDQWPTYHSKSLRAFWTSLNFSIAEHTPQF